MYKFGKKQPAAVVWLLMFLSVVIVLLLNLVGSVGGFQAAAAPLAPDDIYEINASADTYVYEGQPNNNYGNNGYLNVFRTEFLQEGYALIAFDLSALPPEGSITSATLELFMDTGSGTTPVNVAVSRVTNSWNEMSVTWNTRPGDTGNYAVSSVSSTPGTVTWDVTTLVQEWYNGSQNNYGLALKGPAAVSFDRNFQSRENNIIPKLTINLNGPTPTPSETPTPTSTPTLTPTNTPPPTSTPNPDEPELVVSGYDIRGLRLLDYTNEKMLYWSEGADEFCTTEATIKSMNLFNFSVQTLYSSCTNLKDLQIEANYLYFSEGNLIRRIDRHTGGPPTTMATADSPADSLVVEHPNIIFADINGIKQQSIYSDTPTLIAAGSYAPHLIRDRRYFYWIDPVQNTLERMSLYGSDRQTLVSGLGVAPALAIPYYVENGFDPASMLFYSDDGVIYKLDLETLEISEITSTPTSDNIGSMTVNRQSVLWTDVILNGGSVLRANRFGGSPEPIAIGRGDGPGLAQAVQGYIYWAELHGIYRMPINATPFTDLSITGMEITQGVQQLGNFTPLVQGKPTYVRVYPAATIDTDDVQVLLFGEQSGIPLPGSPLAPIDGRMQVRESGHARATWTDSFNFFLPREWQDTNVTLRAVINPSGDIAETSDANNSLSVTRSFNPKSAVCFKFLTVNTDDGLRYHLGMPGLIPIVNRFKTLWPVPEARYYTSATLIGKPFGGSFHMPDDVDFLIFALWEHNFWNGEPGWCTEGNAWAHYIGMIHPNTNTSSGGWTLLGKGSYTEPVAMVKMVGTSTSTFNQPDGGATLAHESAHNYNGLGNRWKHINCGLRNADFNPSWPYIDTMRIADDGPDTGWGFDPLTREVIEPTEARDYMSYCDPVWVSSYNWTGIYNALSTPSLAASSQLQTPDVALAEDMLVAMGTISDQPERNVIISYRLASETLSAKQIEMIAKSRDLEQVTDTTYALELLDSNENVLNSKTFVPMVAADGLFDSPSQVNAPHGDTPDSLSFLVSVPFDPDTASIRVTGDGEELSRTSVSANAPSVSIQTPADGSTIGSQLNLTWTAEDTDGDELQFVVQYSPDGGTTWMALATQYTGNSLSLTDTNEMPASAAGQGQLRVIANDGVLTAMDTVTGLTVENHAPQASIDEPSDGQSVPPDEWLVLNGHSMDSEEGLLEDSALSWFVDGEKVGEGSDLLLPPLDPGYHTVQLTAIDGNGLEGSTEITIFVGTQIFLPQVSR